MKAHADASEMVSPKLSKVAAMEPRMMENSSWAKKGQSAMIFFSLSLWGKGKGENARESEKGRVRFEWNKK